MMVWFRWFSFSIGWFLGSSRSSSGVYPKIQIRKDFFHDPGGLRGLGCVFSFFFEFIQTSSRFLSFTTSFPLSFLFVPSPMVGPRSLGCPKFDVARNGEKRRLQMTGFRWWQNICQERCPVESQQMIGWVTWQILGTPLYPQHLWV